MHFLLLLVRLQQDWNAAKNNPSLLIDYPWEKFFTKNDSALHITSYLSVALSKILPHSKTIKNA